MYLDFDVYQKKAAKMDLGVGRMHLRPGWLYYVLGMAGETGEAVEKIKKLFRDSNNELADEKKMEILLELGDILWYMAGICRAFGVNFSDVPLLNIAKLRARKHKGTIHGDGDER